MPGELLDLAMVLAAFGPLPAFIFTDGLVIAGESAVLADPDAVGITGSVAFGPPFSPAISFAGGAAATAYAARRGYIESGFDYHEAKNIAYALGTKPDVLAVALRRRRVPDYRLGSGLLIPPGARVGSLEARPRSVRFRRRGSHSYV